MHSKTRITGIVVGRYRLAVQAQKFLDLFRRIHSLDSAGGADMVPLSVVTAMQVSKRNGNRIMAKET